MNQSEYISDQQNRPSWATRLLFPSSPGALRLRWIGFGLFVASFFTPDLRAHEPGEMAGLERGVNAFIVALFYLLDNVRHIDGLKELNWLVLIGAAWVNNFSVFFKLRRSFLWVPIAIPWVFYLVISTVVLSTSGSVWIFFPFFPWAIGIGLIHAAGYFEPNSGGEDLEQGVPG